MHCTFARTTTALFLAAALAACPSPATKPDAGPALADASTDAGDGGDGLQDAATADGGVPGPDAASAGPDASRPTACPFGDPGRTVGLLSCEQGAYEGYTLFAPVWSSQTYLVDMFGREVHRWSSKYLPGMSVYLLESGELLRTLHKSSFGGLPTGGGLQKIAWDGSLTWDFDFGDLKTTAPHHDVAPMPGGTVVVLYWEAKTETDVMAKGYAPDGPVWSEALAEVRQTGPTTGEVVWEWHLWDHILPGGADRAAHPELLELSYTRNDWLHVNSVAYNPELDQIVLSSRNLSEIWIIDHGTTTAQAAAHEGGKRGKGGDFLYRWGRPANWGVRGSQLLFGQHCVHWIAPGLPGAGHLLLFNNGNGRGFSTVDELVTPVDSSGNYPVPDGGEPFGPAGPVWRYQADPPGALYANHISGTQRLPNGDTLVCSGNSGDLFEVTPAGAVVWRYKSPVGRSGIAAQGSLPRDPDMFRAVRFAADSPQLAGLALSPGDALEDHPGPSTDQVLAGQCPESADCPLCCASLNLVGYDKLVTWMTPCICGTKEKPGPCAGPCAADFCAEIPSVATPEPACSSCANSEVITGVCTSVREKCMADADCLGFQTCRLACP